MSLGYPPLRPRPDGSHVVSHRSDNLGVPDVLLSGVKNVGSDLKESHPLEYSEQHWLANREQMDFAMLRNSQGLHAPIRLQMERYIAKDIHRLPCMQSSNIMLDNLTGKLDTIDFEDILGNVADAEVVGQVHAISERKDRLI